MYLDLYNFAPFLSLQVISVIYTLYFSTFSIHADKLRLSKASGVQLFISAIPKTMDSVLISGALHYFYMSPHSPPRGVILNDIGSTTNHLRDSGIHEFVTDVGCFWLFLCSTPFHPFIFDPHGDDDWSRLNDNKNIAAWHRVRHSLPGS